MGDALYASSVKIREKSAAEGLGDSLTEETAAWVVHVASLAKRSKGATQVVSGTVIEVALRGKSQDLFSLNRSVILYDITNTYFEGVCAKNPKA